MAIVNKVIIVEGKSDKKGCNRLLQNHQYCTHGTMSIDKLDDINRIGCLYDKQVFVLADSDDGNRIRNWFKRYLSESEHIYLLIKLTVQVQVPQTIFGACLSKHGFTCKKETPLFQYK